MLDDERSIFSRNIKCLPEREVNEMEKNMSKHISPDKIFEIASGYEKSMILFVAHSYDIFSVISNKPATATEVANEIKTNAQATRLLLNALCGLDLLNKRGDRYSNTPIAQRFLVKRKPSYVGNMVKEIEQGMASWLLSLIHISEPTRPY